MARAKRGILKHAFPTWGYAARTENVVPMNDAPHRGGSIAFMEFLLMPESNVAVSNHCRYGSGVSGVGELVDPALARLPESGCQATEGQARFIEVSDEAARAVYSQNWTNVKK